MVMLNFCDIEALLLHEKTIAYFIGFWVYLISKRNIYLYFRIFNVIKFVIILISLPPSVQSGCSTENQSTLS